MSRTDHAVARRPVSEGHPRVHRSAVAIRRPMSPAPITSTRLSRIPVAGRRRPPRLRGRFPELAVTMLGADASRSRQSVTAISDAATDARAQVIGLGVVLGAVEASTSTGTWRNPTEAVRRYFVFLPSNGYVLAEGEQIAAGTFKKPRGRTRRYDSPPPANWPQRKQPRDRRMPLRQRGTRAALADGMVNKSLAGWGPRSVGGPIFVPAR